MVCYSVVWCGMVWACLSHSIAKYLAPVQPDLYFCCNRACSFSNKDHTCDYWSLTIARIGNAIPCHSFSPGFLKCHKSRWSVLFGGLVGSRACLIFFLRSGSKNMVTGEIISDPLPMESRNAIPSLDSIRRGIGHVNGERMTSVVSFRLVPVGSQDVKHVSFPQMSLLLQIFTPAITIMHLILFFKCILCLALPV